MFCQNTGATILGGLATLASLVGIASAAGQQCSTSDSMVDNVPYCNEVDHIRYKNVVSPGGSYEMVTNMNPDSCTCEKSVGTFRGSIAPLDEDMSLHFRGPLELKQVAVYYPAGATKRTTHSRVHGNPLGNLHKRGLGGSLQRTAYYNAEQGTAEGLIFMNNNGGDGSGTFDHCWGSSLSFANSEADGGAKSPQVLKDKFIPSDVEFSIFTDQECDESCGYSRPGAPAYKGFAGKNKAFLFEFAMPDDNSGSANPNMPSIWGLNAKIPRTSQYSDCSCWGSGCGEFDFFEVLAGHKNRVKTHFHADPTTQAGGGSPDYFPRPKNKPVKVAAVFDENGEVHIKMLDNDVQFDSSLPVSTLKMDDSDASVYKVASAA